MADYTFDGKRLVKKSSGQKLAEVDKSTIRSTNAAVFGEIQGRNIRDSHGKKVAMVQDHGGNICVERTGREGTVFMLMLPIGHPLEPSTKS